MSVDSRIFNGVPTVTFDTARRARTAARLLFVFSLLAAAPVVHAASALTPVERAKVIVARHLLTRIGTPALDAAVRDRSLRSDDYWKKVFESAKAPELYAPVAAELRRALNDVPLVQGQPAEPPVFARAVLRGLGPLPLAPLEESPAAEREAILSFARRELAEFSREALRNSDGAEVAAAAAAARATTVFRSSTISQAFFRLGELLSADQASRIDLFDTKDRLNEYLHPYGLHLVIDGREAEAGRVNLASYVVLSKHAFNILGKPFVVYQARPSVATQSTAALGHAEVESGYMFIFANHVDVESAAGLAFAQGAPLDRLWAGDKGEAPLEGLSPAAIQRVEAAVRERLMAGGLEAPQYRALLINTIGRHEGFHMYIEPAVAQAFRRGKIGRSEAAPTHENGAYLYQLERGDPRFVSMDLLMLFIVGMNGGVRFPDNAAGARAALADLQAEVKNISFWDTAGGPIEEGVVKLFTLPPETLQKAASQARWSYEVRLRN